VTAIGLAPDNHVDNLSVSESVERAMSALEFNERLDVMPMSLDGVLRDPMEQELPGLSLGAIRAGRDATDDET
jgi:hypothetical protein